MKSAIRRRGGYTLVEMLIVVSIMIMLVAVSLPVAKKTMEGSHTREASRQLHAYFQMAKSRALQTGRPCGVFFEFPKVPLGGPPDPDPSGWTVPQLTNYWPVRQVTQVFLAEVPAPYSGSTTTIGGKVVVNTGVSYFIPCTIGTSSPDANEVTYIQSLLNPNEQFLVRFNFKGDWYRFNNTTTAATTGFPLAPQQVSTVYPYGAGNANAPGVAFQILRSPRPVGSPMDLPRSTCIDITYSGVGHYSRQFPSSPTGIAANLAVMLAPNGGIDSMYVNGFPTADPIGSLYFLVGKVEKLTTTVDPAYPHLPTDFFNPESSNLADLNSLWVVVNRSNAQVATAENMPDASKAILGLGPYLTAARQAAILGESAGGQ